MEQDFGYRKVQQTGRGAYIITLPKQWVQDLGLEKGSHLAFKAHDKTSLRLVPRKILENIQDIKVTVLNEYRITVDPKDTTQSVCRKIISLYVISADLIHIYFKKGTIPSEYKIAINNLSKNMLLGSEIIEETSNEIILQILISHPEFPVERAIRRMTVLALSANQDTLRALEEMDEKLINGVIIACNDVERLNLYIIRQLKYGLERNIFKELGFKTRKEFLGYRIVANDIKNIANNAVTLANSIIKRLIKNEFLQLNEPIDKEIYSQILKFNSQAHNLFKESQNALFRRDYNRADKLLSKISPMQTLNTELVTLMSTKKFNPNIASILTLILDNSRQITEYSRNIAEITLNRTIDDVSVSC